MSVTDQEYYKLLKINNKLAVSPKTVAEDCDKEDYREWYHVTINENDFPTLEQLESLKWYVSCRCHKVEENNITSNEHTHALVKFDNSLTLKQLKAGLAKADQKLNSKTVFKRVICLDHVIGVLHYICCSRGRNTYRGESKHMHYDHNIFNKDWLHNRSDTKCKTIRNIISAEASEGVKHIKQFDLPLELHDSENCICDRGKVVVQNKRTAFKRKFEKIGREEDWVKATL